LIDHPVRLEDMIRAMSNLNASGPARAQKAQVVSVLSSRGGVGCTSIAVNLACTFTSQPGKQATLIDLDLTVGAVDIALGVESERRLTDMVTSIERMDMQLIRGSLTKHGTGLYVLPRPASLAEIGLVHEDHIQRIIGLLKLLCTHVVLDLSKGWLATDLLALSLSDVILLTIQPELPSIRNAVMILSALANEGLDGKVLVVMNRAGAFFGRDAISVKKAEEVLDRLVYWQIPNDYQPLMDAWNAGEPLILKAPKSKAQQSIASLADDLTRRFQRTEPGAAKKSTNTKIMRIPAH
jgi:pilus assembly protein CpaE